VPITMAGNMLATTARFMFDRNCDPKRTPPNQNNRVLSAHLASAKLQEFRQIWTLRVRVDVDQRVSSLRIGRYAGGLDYGPL